jgi:hypothetical protein
MTLDECVRLWQEAERQGDAAETARLALEMDRLGSLEAVRYLSQQATEAATRAALAPSPEATAEADDWAAELAAATTRTGLAQ